MTRARGPLALALALVALTPGCLTIGVWDWAQEDGVETHKATAIEEVARAPDGGFVVHLRMADGSVRREAWHGEHRRGPAAAYAEACSAAHGGREGRAVEHLAQAVRRGLARRDFTTDPALSPIAGREDVARLAAEPVRLPELILRDQTSPEWVEVVHLAPPEPPEAIIDVQPVSFEVSRGGPLGYAAAVLVTPLTFVLDLVTFPAQVTIAVLLVRGLFD